MAINNDSLVAGAKQWLADMTDEEFNTVVNEVREPADDSETKASTVADGRERFAAKNGR